MHACMRWQERCPRLTAGKSHDSSFNAVIQTQRPEHVHEHRGDAQQNPVDECHHRDARQGSRSSVPVTRLLPWLSVPLNTAPGPLAA